MPPLLQILIAIVIGLVIWVVTRSIIKALATPPQEIDPTAVVEAEQDYKCTVCGTELTVHIASLTETEPPRHCREEMVPVWRP
ncbi:MAG: hypothetical protein ACE5MI_08615 [Acidimicrobiia bacterium]